MDLLCRFARSALLFHKLSGRAHHEALGAGGLKFHLEQRIAAHGLDLRDNAGAERTVRDPGSPTAKAGAALPAGFAAGGAGRTGGLRRGSGAETV